MIPFVTKIFNAEDGTRTLGVFNAEEDRSPRLGFNLNMLEDMRLERGDIETARFVARIVGDMLDRQLTVEEVEYLVKDI